MAKGAIVKEQTYSKMMEYFPGSFMYNGGKELRIDCIEDGVPVQLKVVITAAKTPVAADEDNAIPGAAVVAQESTDVSMESQIEPSALKVSEEEKNKAKALLAAMQF